MYYSLMLSAYAKLFNGILREQSEDRNELLCNQYVIKLSRSKGEVKSRSSHIKKYYRRVRGKTEFRGL